ncbi:hypothetical protein PPYR_12759 [Photinus pyralis]|uniref:Uncharacterized protein n=1 Tax=Photinus pyralis TaxID=7054 RepID=A0A1Y1NA63_PHOPY|nr:uncharacterized protein LOC116178073 [Photinus pyralis]KAB0793139.1 hypothetical protein PPYR_12759 [Photinus pyralis]
MSDLKEQVQKNVVNLCSYLDQHVAIWREALQETESAIRALGNLAEQLRCTERTHLEAVENFQEMKDSAKFSIWNGIELEIATIKASMEKMEKTNNNLKRKLFSLEKLTLDLDWDERHPLINGGPTQPPLSKILFLGLQFWQFFDGIFQKISSAYKSLDVYCERSTSNLANSLSVDLNVNSVNELIALTQYVNNSDAID